MGCRRLHGLSYSTNVQEQPGRADHVADQRAVQWTRRSSKPFPYFRNRRLTSNMPEQRATLLRLLARPRIARQATRPSPVLPTTDAPWSGVSTRRRIAVAFAPVAFDH